MQTAVETRSFAVRAGHVCLTMFLISAGLISAPLVRVARNRATRLGRPRWSRYGHSGARREMRSDRRAAMVEALSTIPATR